MTQFIILFFSSALISNILLTQFLGVCPFLGVSKKRSGALGMGGAVTVVMVLASLITWALYHLVLVPAEVEYMQIIVFILVIASLVQLLEMLLKKAMPGLYKSLGVYLPLITTNCAILGTALTNITNDYSFVQTLVNSLGVALGFTLVIYLFSSIRERLEAAPVPAGFKGIPVALIVASVMAIAFSSIAGAF